MATTDHLERAAAEMRRDLVQLRSQTKDLEEALASVESLIKRLRGETLWVSAVEPVRQKPTIREALMEFASAVPEFTFVALMERLKELGVTTNEASVSSIISRQLEIERVRKGVYRLRNLEAPAEARASISIPNFVAKGGDGDDENREIDRGTADADDPGPRSAPLAG
jgi:hypothetical protein